MDIHMGFIGNTDHKSTQPLATDPTMTLSSCMDHRLQRAFRWLHMLPPMLPQSQAEKPKEVTRRQSAAKTSYIHMNLRLHHWPGAAALTTNTSVEDNCGTTRRSNPVSETLAGGSCPGSMFGG